MIECLYDEDLSENSFFRELKLDYQHLIDRATTEGWIICVPKIGSFENAHLTEDDFLYHILKPVEGLSENLYETLNDKRVRINNQVITIEDDIAVPSLSTQILFEETFYTQDLLNYKVWCIECLLNQNYIKSRLSKDNVNSVLTLRDCIDFLWTESLGKEILEHLDSAINKFLEKNPTLYKYSLPVQRELVSNLYAQCLEISLCDTRLNESISKNKPIIHNVNISVEAYMQHNIYKPLFSSISVHTGNDDASFNKIVRNLSETHFRDLDITPDVFDSIPCAKRQLAKINGFSTILGKISCLRQTVSEISQCSSKSHSSLSVDDLLPVLVFLLLKSGIPNWIANLCFLKQFQFSYLSTGDEVNFLITTLEASIEYIRSGILLSPTEPDSCVSNKKVDKNTISYFFEQVRTGNYDEVKAILLKSSTSKDDFEVKLKELCHPLCSCDKCENLFSNILCSNTPTVHSSDDRGYTALHIACMNGKPKIVELLLEFEADIRRCDYSGATPLHYAAMRGHQNALLLLLHSGADVNATDNEKNTPLHLCCNNGHDACIKAILYFAEHQTNILNINCTNVLGDTPLHYAVKWGYRTIVLILLEHGADPTIENNLKKNCFDYAHNLNIYQILTQAKCTVKEIEKSPVLKNNDENTFDFVEEIEETEKATKPCSPLEMKKAELLLRAVAYDDVPMICYYLGIQIPDNLAKNEGSSSTLCHPLCDCEKCEMLQDDTLINPKDKQDINICNSEGYTALHVASLHGLSDIVQLLLNNGALHNVVTNKGLTALHLACQTERIDIVKLLLECDDCKINVQDAKGNTPLHYACYSRDANIIHILLQHKADARIRNSNGKSALEEIEKMKLDFTKDLQEDK